MVDRGLQNIGVHEKPIYLSDEFKSLFEVKRYDVGYLYLFDIVEEFYPVFKNDLFVLIKEAAQNCPNYKLESDYVKKYLRNIKDERIFSSKKKEQVVSEISKIDVETENKIVKEFENLINSIESNRSISDGAKRNIINNIRAIFRDYRAEESEYLQTNLDDFFMNCMECVNNLAIMGDDGMDGLVSAMTINCKDFFIEYDYKKFKEIVEYVVKETNLSFEALKVVASKCEVFFKDADIEKLKLIKETLDEFKNYVNNTFNSGSEFGVNILDNILINNPEFLLRDSNVKDVIGFLKGKISLNDYGYYGPLFKLEKDFFSYDFYKKIEQGNYELLFNCDLSIAANNLIYIEDLCRQFKIDFNNFRINEDTIYLLLSKNFYNDNFQTIKKVRELFSAEDFKTILELNPELWSITPKDLEIIIKRSLLNQTSEYDFYDLLVGELLLYKEWEYRNYSFDYLVDRPLRCVDVKIDAKREFSPLDIFTSGYMVEEDCDKLWNSYNERKACISMINNILTSLEEKDYNDDDFYLNASTLISLYSKTYVKIADVSIKNRIIDVISKRKENYEFLIDDAKETIQAKYSDIEKYKIRKKDADFVAKELEKLVDQLEDSSVHRDVRTFIEKLKSIISDEKSRSIRSNTIALENSEKEIEILQKGIAQLEYLLSNENMAYDDDVYAELKSKKSFCVRDMIKEEAEANDDIFELLGEKNLVLFADGVDLSDIPNDIDFIGKVHKFLADTEFSLTNKGFMQSKTLDKNFVEKLTFPRKGIWSRRESMTSVRVYFIPIHTQYFTCYYVIHVNYKDHEHLDGGCSTDSVYNRRLREAEEFKKKIEKFTKDELMEFIKETKDKYNSVMEPIVSKIEDYNKRRNGKK
jgi:hypothetical protein